MLGSTKWSFAWWLVVALAVSVAVYATVPAIARPTPGYGDLIDNYCISQGRLKVAAHQSHCAMCHQTGTFDDRPDHRVQPNWTEYERGKATGDFSYFCPGQASAVTPPNSAPSPVPPAASAAPSPSAPLAQAPPPMAPGPDMGMGMAREHGPRGSEMGTMGPRNTPGPPSSSPPMNMGQPAPPASPPAMAMTGPNAPAAASSDRAPIAPAEVEQRLTRLREEIRIADNQRANWDALAEAVRAAAARHREFADTASPPPSVATDAVALLQLQQRRMSARIAAIRSVSTAFTRLLAVLDDDQRKTANEQFSSVLDAM